jgi:hypothetical protein
VDTFQSWALHKVSDKAKRSGSDGRGRRRRGANRSSATAIATFRCLKPSLGASPRTLGGLHRKSRHSGLRRRGGPGRSDSTEAFRESHAAAERHFCSECQTCCDDRPPRSGARSAGSPTLSGDASAARARSVARFSDRFGLSTKVLRRTTMDSQTEKIARFKRCWTLSSTFADSARQPKSFTRRVSKRTLL